MYKRDSMLYNVKGETFKFVQDNNKTKLYHKAVNKWSSGWTFIGTYANQNKAETAARLYAN